MALTTTTLLPKLRRRTGVTASSDEETVLKDLLDETVAHIYAKGAWTWRRIFVQQLTQAPYTTGTIAVSGTAVTGTDTDFTAITDYDSAEDPFFLRVNDMWLRIDSFTDATHAVLKVGVDTTVAAGTTYGIYRAWVALDSTLAVLLSVDVDDYGTLAITSPGALDADYAYHEASSAPETVALVMDTSSKGRRIAIRPMLDEAKVLHIWGLRAPPLLSDLTSDALMPDYFSELILSGTLARWYAGDGDDRADLAQQYGGRYVEGLDTFWAEDQRHGEQFPRRRWTIDTYKQTPGVLVDTGDIYGPV